MAKVEDGKIKIRNLDYKILILPSVETIPLKTMQFIEKYMDLGGVVIVLERLPERSTGYADYQKSDDLVRELSGKLFKKQPVVNAKGNQPYGLHEPKLAEGVTMNSYGKGRSYFLKNVINRQIWWDKRSSTLDPFLETIRTHISPDFGIDFAFEGMRKNDGLTFIHRKLGDRDIYFVSNIQDKQSDIPIHLKPYESLFLEFSPGKPDWYVTKTDFAQVLSVKKNELTSQTTTNGTYVSFVTSENEEKKIITEVSGIPAPYHVSGNWSIALSDTSATEYKSVTGDLFSWTDNPVTQAFSGTGNYEINFSLSSDYLKKDIILYLDLGKVGNIAEVSINHIPVGTTWMRGQRLDVTKAVKEGLNLLNVMVTNTLINRVSAMKEPPRVPAELISRFGSEPVNKDTPREFGFKPLPASGLIGPVQLVPEKIVTTYF
jgi:hypothetical protein